MTEKQWLQVRTPSFKKWFGDWESDPENASKVVDENGEPKVVYHGTPNGEFSVFDKNRLGETTDRTNAKMSTLGFYFTNDDWIAKDYAKFLGTKSNPHMFSVFLRTVNPLVVEDDGWGSAVDQTDARRSDLARWAKEDNNDGIIVVSTDYELENDELDTVYVVTEPNQIKSATDNVGTFDKDDPDIRYSMGDVKYSIGDSSNSNDNSGIINAFRHPLDTLGKKFGLKPDKIITDEDEKARKREEINKVIEAYLKNPNDKEIRKRKKELHINNDMIAAYANGEEYLNDINLKQYFFGSASRIAKKLVSFRVYYNIGKKATEKVISLRDSFNRDYGAVMDLVKSKEDKKALFDLLLVGDREGKEYGTLTDEEKVGKTGKDYTNARIDKIVEEAGVKRNVAEAYIGVRRMLNRMYNLINDARRKPKNEAKWLPEDEIKNLKENKFAEILKEYDAKDEKGKRLVAWKEYANHKQTYSNITQEMYDKFKNDDAIQILKSKEVKDANGETLYNIETREALPALNKLIGYLPHFFHDFMVRVRDKDGKTVKTIGSGRTQREAIKIAEEWLKNNKLEAGQEITALPKVFNFEALGMKEEDFAPIMGDKDFFKMLNKIAKNNELTIPEAKQLVDGSVKLKNRHRFLGNTLHRKGVEGYSEDVEWILRHFFNQGSRYAALETEFKPQAISLFERMYGSFDKDWSGNKLAQYTKDFINDVNGTPTHLETMINEALNKSSIFKNFVTPMFGDRAALTLATNITSKVGVLKLGVWNVSSAFLNYSQLLNAGGYLGGYGRLLKHAARIARPGYKLSRKELRILAEVGTLSDIGMDTATGYDKNRNYDNDVSGVLGRISWLFSRLCGNKSMHLFKAADMHCRIATTFAAYEQAIAEGKSRQEAINFARETNVKANFDYSVVDSPNILRRASIFGKIIGQFQKYPIKQIELMSDFAPFSKKTTKAQKIAFWAPYLLACGLVGGIPAFNWLDELFKKFNINLKDGIQEWVMQNFKDSEIARTIGKVIMYGSGAAANVDFSTRAGLGDIRLPSLGGPLWNTIEGVVTNTAKGEYLNALRSFSPGMYNFVAFCEGETFEKRGRKKDELDPYDRVIRLLGFKSVDESLDTDMKRIRNDERTKLTEEKQKAMDAYIKNPTTENYKRCEELGIKKSTIDEEKKKKRTTKRDRFESSMTKQERKDHKFDYMLEFAK